MADLDDVRDWVGTEPDDDTVTAALDRHDGDARRAALSILRRRRADLVDAVQRIDIDGDYSETSGSLRDRLAAVGGLIARLERLTGDDAGTGLPTLTSAPLCAPRGSR